MEEKIETSGDDYEVIGTVTVSGNFPLKDSYNYQKGIK